MKAQSPTSRQSGFTIIEIIVTLIILAILSAMIMSRFSGGNDFNGVIIRDQLVSLIRNGRQLSLGRADVSIELEPDGAGENLSVITRDNGGVVNTTVLDMDSVGLSGDVNETDDCATTNGGNNITNGSTFTLNFGDLGDLDASGVTGSEVAVTSALRVCIDNTPNISVCVSPAGFAYVGNCDV